MARLISYPTISTLALGDLFPVTDMSAASRPLKNVTVESLTNFVISKSPFAFNATHPTAIQSANNLALGNFSVAMGSTTTASGLVSTAMGGNTTATGLVSTAMGYNTIASGQYSTAMGNLNVASGGFSTAMGNLNAASGGFSTAMGNGTTASGSNSTAMGRLTEASGFASVAIGQYNVINNGDSTNVYAATNTAFSIGNGTSSASRSNALSVLFNGNVTAGSVIATSLEVERPDSGLILKSPDGTRYRITMANGGSLVITAV